MSKLVEPAFKDALAMMRSRDPQTAEDGFSALAATARDHVAELIAEFERETQPGVRCWLLELIGEARSPEAFDVLCAYALSDDRALKTWAIWGLTQLDTKEARTFMFEKGVAR